MKKCIHCNCNLKDDDLFCYKCGTKQNEGESLIIEKNIKCPNCGTFLLPSDSFCPFCGERIETNKSLMDSNIDKANVQNSEFTNNKNDLGILPWILGIFAICFIIVLSISNNFNNNNNNQIIDNNYGIVSVPDIYDMDYYTAISVLNNEGLSYIIYNLDENQIDNYVVDYTLPYRNTTIDDSCQIEVYLRLNETIEQFDYGNSNMTITCQIQMNNNVRIRNRHNVNDDLSIVGRAYVGEVYNVYEVLVDTDYIWYRVDYNYWIANNGEWITVTNIDYDNVWNCVNSSNESMMLTINDYDVGIYNSPNEERFKTSTCSYGSNYTCYNCFVDLSNGYTWYEIGEEMWIKEYPGGSRISVYKYY